VTDVTGIRILRRGWTLKITRAANGEVVIRLSGRMGAENRFLRRCEAESIQIKNFPAYIGEWITGEQR
jgi:hypothetical protein